MQIGIANNNEIHKRLISGIAIPTVKILTKYKYRGKFRKACHSVGGEKRKMYRGKQNEEYKKSH